jgi:replicative DNA helicase
MLKRVLSLATGIPHYRFRGATLSPEDKKRVYDVCSDLGDLPLKIFHHSYPGLDDIMAAAHEARPRVLFVDYLQRCEMPKEENMAYRIGEFMRGLKTFSMDAKVTTFIACQSDRELDRNPTVPPQMAHLKGSGAIEAESDGVLMLWTPPAEVIAKRSDWVPASGDHIAIEAIIRKNRNGPRDAQVDLELNGELIKITERGPVEEPRQERLPYSEEADAH